MNILIVTGHFPTYPETFVWTQVSAFLANGEKVFLVADNRGEDSILKKLAHPNLRVVYRRSFNEPVWVRYGVLFRSLLSRPAYFMEILKSLNFLRYRKEALTLLMFYKLYPFLTIPREIDVVHAHHGGSGAYVAEMKSLGVIRNNFLTSFHGSDINRKSLDRDYSHLKNSGIIYSANSEYTMNNMIAHGFDREKIRLIPMGVDSDFFKRNRDRQNTGIIEILSVGRLIEIKGFEFAIRAMDLLRRKEIVQFRYRIAGDGILREHLQQLIDNLSLNDHVELLGYQHRQTVRDLMEESDIFILPGITDSDGRQEAQGLVIQEAQAMELPALVSNIGGMKYGIIDKVTGFLCHEKDPDEIASKLQVLIGNAELRKDFGKKGREFILENFDNRTMMKKFYAVYRELNQNPGSSKKS